MGHLDATASAETAESAGMVTSCVTLKSRRIRTYGRGSNSMKTIDFNPCISHTYDDRACNPRICNTYEKQGGGG